jgi:hypothetical protein
MFLVLLLFLGVTKFWYEELKYPLDRSTADFDKRPARNNWMPEVKKSFATILFRVDDPPVLLTHFVIGVVFRVKPYGQYGQFTKRLDTAYAVINYALLVNRVLVPHHKVGGQQLH